MHLMYYTNEKGERQYTLLVSFVLFFLFLLYIRGVILNICSRSLVNYILFISAIDSQKVDPNGKPTVSAHPARFSPDDKFSKERITCKKRFNILPTQVTHSNVSLYYCLLIYSIYDLPF